MEEKKFVKPEMEIIIFENDDIIVASNGTETDWAG